MKIKLMAEGVLAVGKYQAGEEYDVEDAEEAQRLIDLKGFIAVVEPDVAVAAAPKAAPKIDKTTEATETTTTEGAV